MATPSIAYAGSPLERGRPRGAAESWYDEALRAPGTRLAAFHGLRPLIRGARAAWLTPAHAAGHIDDAAVFLGREGGTAYFAIDVSGRPEDAFAPYGTFTEMRAAAALLPPGDLAILGHGRALSDWHARHRFCARCGAPTRRADGGAKRLCGTCDAEHFPRTDPVVIMLAARGGMALLGRQARMPPGLYTALAGFVEQGETVEEAVARETYEEAGIRVGHVRYFASQPWPFPSSLMIACFARALNETVSVDKAELEDARWFPRAEVAALLARPYGGEGLFAPPPFAIAHRLLAAWAHGEVGDFS